MNHLLKDFIMNIQMYSHIDSLLVMALILYAFSKVKLKTLWHDTRGIIVM